MSASKNFRLHEKLRQNFETFCRENLLDERKVVEAWILRFLEATEAERRQVATRYADWLDDESDPADLKRRSK